MRNLLIFSDFLKKVLAIWFCFIYNKLRFKDGFPSGQRGQTVNLLATLSKVRILLHPLKTQTDVWVFFVLSIPPDTYCNQTNNLFVQKRTETKSKILIPVLFNANFQLIFMM